MTAELGGDRFTRGVVRNVVHLIFRQSQCCDQSFIGRHVVALAATNDNLRTCLRRCNGISKGRKLGISPLEEKLLVYRHDRNDLEVRRTILRILHHRHKVTTIEGEERIVRLLPLCRRNIVASNLARAVRLIRNDDRLTVHEIILREDV